MNKKVFSLMFFTSYLTVAVGADTTGHPVVGETPSLPKGFIQDCVDCPVMVVIPPGEIILKDVNTSSVPLKKIEVSHLIAIGQTEVTDTQFRYFLQRTGYYAGDAWNAPAKTAKQPAVNVDWNAAIAYVRWLSRHTGQRYRLASESEWTYAARAGKPTRYWWGDDADEGCGKEHLSILFFPMSMTTKCSSTDNPNLVDMASMSANQFGLYDMVGNAGEWVLGANACGGLDFWNRYHVDACSIYDFEINPIHTGLRVVRELP